MKRYQLSAFVPDTHLAEMPARRAKKAAFWLRAHRSYDAHLMGWRQREKAK